MHDEPECLRFALVDRLHQAELLDLEATYRTAESVRAARPMAVDLARLSSSNPLTQAQLDRLQALGATVIGREAKQPCSGGRRR